ncbi:ABC transporter substrate-binding protein [Kineococcus indalonis]|uniref:ABC transporter substrate-binding protein n=1 Tax=Kineococcus indalonis TaxID=2696566 RepID=UPI0014121E4D|nr:ABC transporter substrate-binding protein [Kineococcus indalonis]NAZ86720.1 ABC transporter substrate-binding protein [Kineococcus indalonis]
MTLDRRQLLLGSLLAGIGGTAFLSACGANDPERSGQGSGQGSTERGGTLTVLVESTSTNFDPAKSQSLAITSLGLVHRRLTAWRVTSGQPAELVPDLATDTGTAGDDGRTWTFTLKDGLLFSDGTPIRAQDVKWGLERSFAAAFSGGLTYHKDLLAGADGYAGPFEGARLDSIATPDEKTIVFTLERPYGDWGWIASTPAFAPVPEGKGAEADYGLRPIASGPYAVTANQQGVRIELTRNERWSADTDEVRPALPDTVVFSLGQSADVVSQRLAADSGDDQSAFGASFVSPAQLAQVAANPSVKDRLVTSESGALAFLALNTSRGPLRDVNVRKAFQYAVDKAGFQVASAGTAALAGEVATTLITDGIAGREEFDLYGAPAEGDPARAKQLLADAGFPQGLSGLRLLVSQDNNGAAKGQAVQASLAQAGIQVVLDVRDSDAYYAAVNDVNPDEYDLALASWQPDFPSANANIQPLFASNQIGGGGYNSARYSNPAVDAAIEQAQAAVDPDAAAAAWVAIDKQVMADSPVVPLIYTRNSFLRGSKVTNFFIGAFPAYPNYLAAGVAQ